jgi:phosphoserine phosphatase
LASFDIDGTLVRGVSTGAFLAQKMGHAEAMQTAEALYAAGQVANDYVSTLDGQFYRGYSKAQIFALLDDLPFIADIEPTLAALSARGIPVVLCTLAWEVVAEYVAQRFGFSAWSGPALHCSADGRFSGAVARHFDEFGKPVFIQNQCNRRGIALVDVCHIGDSRSDLELFKQVGFSIALNATADARAVASVALQADSLLDILDLLA